MKRALSLIFAIIMLLALFTACGAKEDKPSDASSNPSANVSNAPADPDDDPDEIEILLSNMGYDISDLEKVEAAINAISEAEIGVHVNMQIIQFADYATQLSLAIANREQIDLALFMPWGGSSFMSLYSGNMMLDITDYIDENCPDVKNFVGDLMKTTSVDGRVYALPTYRNLNSNYYAGYRTDYLTQAGVLEEFENMTTWAEFENVLNALSQLDGVSAIAQQRRLFGIGICYTGTNLSDNYSFDYLGDSLYIVWTDQNGNVEMTYNRDDIVGMYKMARDWYDKGYVYSDTAISSEPIESLIMQGTAAGALVMGEFGIETSFSRSCGTDMSIVQMAGGTLNTGNAQKFGMFVPSTSANPEAALRFMNLVYTNAELSNLFAWGIEGTNYEVNENGEAQFMEGKDSSSSGYYYGDFLIGNQFLILPWAGNGGASFREMSLADYKSATASIYLGLTVDTSSLDSIVAVLGAVTDEYLPQISSGLYTDKLYAEFLNKLNAADVDTYLKLYADSVSEWMA